MGIEVTQEAVEVLRRSLELAKVVDASEAGVRLRSVHALGGGSRIEVEFADGPSPNETVLEKDGIRIFIDPSVHELFPDAVVAVEPQHERVVVRPADPAGY